MFFLQPLAQLPGDILLAKPEASLPPRPSVGPQSHHVCPQVSPSSYAGRGILTTLSVTEGLWGDLLNTGLGEPEEKRSQWYSDPLGGGGRRAIVQYPGNAQRRRYVRGLRVRGTSQSVRYLGGTVTRFPNPRSARKELLQIQMCFQSNTIFLHVKQVQKQPPERH